MLGSPFYDIIEGLYRVIDDKIRHSYGSMRIQLFVNKVNKALMEDNIGWQLADGKVVTRGDEVFEGTVKTAVTVLEEAVSQSLLDIWVPPSGRFP